MISNHSKTKVVQAELWVLSASSFPPEFYQDFGYKNKLYIKQWYFSDE